MYIETYVLSFAAWLLITRTSLGMSRFLKLLVTSWFAVVVVAHIFNYRIGSQHRSRSRHTRDAASRIHRTAEPVTGSAHRHARGNARPQPWEVVVGVDDLNQLEDRVE